MSRIVLTTVGSLGDLHPMVAIALSLRDRGHDIVFATSKEYQAKIESLGLKFHALRPYDMKMDDPKLMELMMDLRKGTERVFRDYIFANLRETFIDLMAAAQNADLIVSHEIVFATPIVAEKLQIPWVFCALVPGSFFSAYDPMVLPPFPALAKLRPLGPRVNRLVRDYARFISRSWGEPVHQLRLEIGLPPVNHPIIDDKFSPYLNLALFSQIMAVPQPDWPAKTVVTGFTFYDGKQSGVGLTPELQHFLDTGEPPIVFTLGSAAVFVPGKFYQESIQAAQQLNRRAVLLIGKNQLPEDLPAGIIACDYAPYSEIFPRACAIVHQGGIGTTAQGLRSGRPTIVVPYSHDQPDNAARLERLGTSRTIERQRYAATVAVKQLGELLDNPKYAAKAAEIGRSIETEDGVKVACDGIERLLRVEPKATIDM
jgi:rhamnosyltransferase subunit B